MRPDGSLCENPANEFGYCKDCDPVNLAQKKREAEKRKKEAKREEERKDREEQRREILAEELHEMITGCRSLEDLRKLELRIIKALIEGSIPDPRVGSPLAQLLKHQEALIRACKGNADDLEPHQRDRAIQLAKQMSPEQMLGLIGDLAQGMRLLSKQVRQEDNVITISAREVVDA
jgi:hypothetical protein